MRRRERRVTRQEGLPPETWLSSAYDSIEHHEHHGCECKRSDNVQDEEDWVLRGFHWGLRHQYNA